MYPVCQTCGKVFTEEQIKKGKNANREIKYCSSLCWGRRKRKHGYDETFLDSNSELSSYFIGLFVASGNYTKNGQAILINVKEKQLVDNLVSKTSYTNAVLKSAYRDGSPKPGYMMCYAGNIRSRIHDMGYRPGPKAAISFLPERCKTEDMFGHFMRGMIDGRGNILVLYPRGNIVVRLGSKSKKLLVSIFEELKIRELVHDGEIISPRQNFYILKFEHLDSVKICDYIYKNSSIKSESKYYTYLKGKNFEHIILSQKDLICAYPNCIELAISKKLCKKHYNKQYRIEYYENHKEQIYNKDKCWKEKNRAKINEKRREAYKNDPDKFKTISYRWKRENVEKVKAYKQQHRKDNKDKINEYKRAYRQAHLEHVREQEKKSVDKRREKKYEQNKEYKNKHREELRQKANEYRERNKEKLKMCVEAYKQEQLIVVGQPINEKEKDNDQNQNGSKKIPTEQGGGNETL